MSDSHKSCDNCRARVGREYLIVRRVEGGSTREDVAYCSTLCLMEARDRPHLIDDPINHG